MPASAERPANGQQGFTLLEVLITVALVGFVLLPILTVREQATNRAIRAKMMLLALHHGQEMLAKYGRELDQVDKYEGRIEELEGMRYEVTFQDWDLSTGRAEDEKLDDDPFSNDYGALAPSDAVAEEEEQAINDPHRVRRFSIKIFYPDVRKEDAEEQLVLEGFIPRMWERKNNSLDSSDR